MAVRSLSKPNIFNYLDYRHYLRDFYHFQKHKKGDAFSFRSFSRLAGLSSPNFLKLVMEGKRSLGKSGMARFARGLGLNKSELAFFENLVLFNQAAGDEERNLHYQNLARSKKYLEIREIEKNQFVYYSHWYNAAIRELVLLPDFKEDPAWISQKLFSSITPDEARASLELLLKLGFIKKNRSRKLVQAERNISTSREVESPAVANYHRQMIRQAYEAVEKTPASQRDISSLTVAISEKKFREAKRRIQEFRRELNLLLSEDAKADTVYQINFQFFNLAGVPWRKKTGSS